MKIVFLARRFNPDIGGVEKHVHEISTRLIEMGHEVSVITQSQGNINEIDRIKIIRIEKTPKKSFQKVHIWKWIIKNRKVFSEADVIHAHDVLFWYFPLKLLFLSKKCFITFHGYESYPINKKAIWMRKLSEKIASGNIIVGDFIKKWYGTIPDYVIYGGVEIPKRISSPDNLESAVFIGRLDEHTGILDYVKSVEIIKKSYSKFDFIIVGDGPYLKKLANYKPLGFRKDPISYLGQYNFAFVSRYLSILEALACKRLVFALFDNPIKEDYLKMAPFAKFIIISNSFEEISEKVKYYLNNTKESDKLIDEGYEWVSKQTWENVVNTYLNLWKK